jgi:hypothetical protein
MKYLLETDCTSDAAMAWFGSTFVSFCRMVVLPNVVLSFYIARKPGRFVPPGLGKKLPFAD